MATRRYIIDTGTNPIADGIGSFTLLAKGKIKQVSFAIGMDATVDATAELVLAKNAATYASANNPDGVANNFIASVTLINQLTTSGAASPMANIDRFVDVDVQQGDVITLSGTGTGTSNAIGHVVVHVQE